MYGQSDPLAQFLASVKLPGVLKVNEPLSQHSTWRIGGAADFFLQVNNFDQLPDFIRKLRATGFPYIVIGQGSNLLFSDQGYRGIVLKLLSGKGKIKVKGNLLYAEANIYVPYLAKKALDHGLSGIEHTIGIPGTLGGLVVMNGGTMRRGIGENIKQVEAIDHHGKLMVLPAEECKFGYRSSLFQQSPWIVISVILKLTSGNKIEMREMMLKILADRNRKFPRKLPSCGSVFVSDPKLYESVGAPGYVIEKLGLKDYRIGGAVISEHHANFIINEKEAKSEDVLTLIKLIHHKIKEEHGISLTVEAKYVDPVEGVVSINKFLNN